ncbi:GntR family transcriptional regulator [Leifsonia kafniensis]|uniref:GntR family transcriptional regulator n=1 Tax=Leifsonia kafniensis TaxID=475957 RepID=A0ABP7KG33_9MICO
MAIERKTLRAQVRDELLARMRSGDAQPGEGINEVHLAAELGVSRTPLREALIGLESEGQITSENGKGFRFVELSANEFEELGPVIATLEGLAIELTPLDDLKSIGHRLAKLSEEFHQDVAAHAEVAHRDDEWHGIMLSACPNSRLLEIIGGVRGLFHRYESLLVSNEAMIQRVAAEHATIANLLIEGDVDGAKQALKANWLNGVQRILANSKLRSALA